MSQNTENTVTSVPEVGNKEGYPVYLVRCGKDLRQIGDFIDGYGSCGPMRIVFDREGNETSSTIVLASKDTYKSMCKDELDKHSKDSFLTISPFELRDNSYPKEHQGFDLFVPIPKTLKDNGRYIHDAVESKLLTLAEWNIIPEKSWKLVIPLLSRETGETKGKCYVNFKPEVTLSQRALARLVIDDTYWPELDDYPEVGDDSNPLQIFKCFWARKLREKRDPESSPDDKDFKVVSNDRKKKGAAKFKGSRSFRL